MEKDSPSFRNQKEEDEYYMKQIQKLLNDKIQLFVDRYRLSQQVQHVDKTKVTLKRPTVISHDEDENKMKKKKIQKQIISPPVVNNAVTEELKEFITHQMNGTELKLVIQKVLYTSDLLKNQNRLNMPINQLQTQDFLTAKEKQDLDKGYEYEVPLLGPTLEVYKELMVLTLWHLQNSKNYVLKTKWYKFVEANKKDLKEKTKIQVWSYRKEQQLCFALACIERPTDVA